MNNKFWSIAKFAKFAHVSRYQLMHYDEIGLLSPLSRGEANKYRYYHSRQLTQVNLIRTFQKLGMTLEEIKSIEASRTPKFIDELLIRQAKEVDAQIDEWVNAKKLLFTLQKAIHSGLNIDEDEITIQHMPAEAIILGDLNDYSKGRDDYDALSDFYYAMSKKYPVVDINYAAWGRFSENRIKKGDWVFPDRYYFYNPEGYDRKPAALYAIGYKRGGYGQSDELYKRIIQYIDEQGFEICGDAYEEYPHNEVCITDESSYLMRVMITVRKKTKHKG